MSDALLDFSRVTVIRDRATVLDDFSLAIPAGQHVAILGPNGSGKSTLLKLVTRELYPVALPESSVTILGPDRWTLWDLRAAVGVVSNDLLATCTRRICGPITIRRPRCTPASTKYWPGSVFRTSTSAW